MSKLIVVLAALSFLLGNMSGIASAADMRTCQVDRVSGDNVVLRTIFSQPWWIESAVEFVGQNIPVDTTVKTGPDSRVVLQCDDKTTITVGPDTEIALADLVGESGPEHNVLLRLLQGIVGIVAPNRNWNKFEVETSVATASVRSTEWLVESSRESGTAVFVTVGSVDVQAAQQAYVLMEGEGVTLKDTVTQGLEPLVAEVKSWGEKRIAKSRSALGFDWE